MELNQWPALVVGFFGCLPGFSGGISVVAFQWWVSFVELNRWLALVVGFFRSLLDPFSGGFRCLLD